MQLVLKSLNSSFHYAQERKKGKKGQKKQKSRKSRKKPEARTPVTRTARTRGTARGQNTKPLSLAREGNEKKGPAELSGRRKLLGYRTPHLVAERQVIRRLSWRYILQGVKLVRLDELPASGHTVALGLAILTNRPFGSVNAYLSGHVLLDEARGTQSTYHLQAEHVTIYLRESDIHLIRYALLDL